MDKGNNKDKAGKPKEARSVFHDDDNLQDGPNMGSGRSLI